MSKELMNEAERFLLEHWEDSRLLEKAMKGIRTKYQELFEQVVRAVTKGHPELDTYTSAPMQRRDGGPIGFGRKSWPSDKYGYTSGLWVDGLLLDMLATEDSDPPCAYIWFPMSANLNSDAARVVVNEEAKKLLNPEELKGATSPNEDEVLLYLPAPSKGELLNALSGGDGRGFVQLFVSQFDMMARFVPVLDRVFQDCLSKK